MERGREGGRRGKERTSLQHFSGSLANAYIHIYIYAIMPPPSVFPLTFPSSLSSPLHSLLPPSPLPSSLTPWVQSLEVVIKSDFEGPIRRLSEEGWNNPGECECVYV